MSNDVVIGIDASTTAAKAVAWTATGMATAEGRGTYPSRSPLPGFAEQDADDWWRGICRALRGCAQKLTRRQRVRAIGITVQRETFVLLDDHMRPLLPAILWYDARGADSLAGTGRRVGRRRYQQTTGKQLDVTAAICKLNWVRDQMPDTFARTAHLADVLAYLAWRLTDNLVTTWAGADTTGLISLSTRDWHAPHLALAGLSRGQMPVVVPPGTVLGSLTERAAAASGLPGGIPVVAGGGDGHCFALGAGLGRRASATLTLGTGTVLGLTVSKPLLGREYRTCLACVPGRYLLETVIQCGSATIAWLHDTLLQDNARSPAHFAAIDRQCADLPPGSDGLLVLPYWRGMRVPHNDPVARGVTVGWTDRHTAAHFHRAIMEGIALAIGAILRRITARDGVRLDRVVLGGGGAAGDAWCRILADVIGSPCHRPRSLETASLGAAMLAMAAVEKTSVDTIAERVGHDAEVFRPDAGRRQVYAELAKLQGQLYRRTRDVCHRLGEIEGIGGRG